METLKQFLIDSDMTQTELAVRLGVSQPTVWGWINGDCRPRTNRLMQISKLTGIPLEKLVADLAPHVA